jgi:hypothetical protein
MMVINEMALAMDAQRQWTEDVSEQRKDRERGAKIYFVRLQISHINEAMAIIQEIRNDPALMMMVDSCGARTRKAFDELLAFKGCPEFTVMRRIRNNLTFHYDPKTIESAMRSLVTKHPDASGTISLGDEPHNWFFEPGDMVADRAASATNHDLFTSPDQVVLRKTEW